MEMLSWAVRKEIEGTKWRTEKEEAVTRKVMTMVARGARVTGVELDKREEVILEVVLRKVLKGESTEDFWLKYIVKDILVETGEGAGKKAGDSYPPDGAQPAGGTLDSYPPDGARSAGGAFEAH